MLVRSVTLTVLALCMVASVFGTPAQGAVPDSYQKYVVSVEDVPYTIWYRMPGGSVKSITADAATASVNVRIQADSDGELQLRLPASFWSKVFPNPGDLVFFVDEVEEFGNETAYDCYTVLQVAFSEGTEKIDIMGTMLLSSNASANDRYYPFTTQSGSGDAKKPVSVATNADDCSFSFVEKEKKLHVDISGPKLHQGFFQVEIPHYFIGGNYTVFINDEPTEFKQALSAQQDVTTISFNYDGNAARTIDIVGTTAMPEFGPIAVLAAALSVVAVLALNRSRR